MKDFWSGFEKCALNALKARELAAKHGLIPEGAWKWGLRNLRKGKTKEQLGAVASKASPGKPGRVFRSYDKGQTALVDALEHRHKSKYPVLLPSGVHMKIPAHINGQDIQRFMHQDVGTHHNIVAPGTGTSIHTVRPDKKTGGKKLRSLLFKETVRPNKKKGGKKLQSLLFKEGSVIDSWLSEAKDEEAKLKKDKEGRRDKIDPRELSEWPGPDAWHRGN